MAEPGGTMWVSVPQAARRLGISERAVRKRITAGHIEAEREGTGPWRVRVGTAPEAAPEAAPVSTEGGTTAEPLEAEYRVTPAAVEQAIARTGQQYTADLRAILGELRAVYEGQLAAKDETIAELRRRAEGAEAERDRLATAQVAQDGPGATETLIVVEKADLGLWGRLRRLWRGD